MKITIKCKPKEIAALALELQSREETEKLRCRIAKLESTSTTNSFYFGGELTFPEYVRKTEKIISRLADCDKKDG